MMAGLAVYGAVVAVLLVLAIPGELRREAPAPRREPRPLGWSLQQAVDRRDGVDPGARWEPLRRRPVMPGWLAEDPGPRRQGSDGWWSGVAIGGAPAPTHGPPTVHRLALPLRTGADTNFLPFRSPTTWRRSFVVTVPATQRMEALA
jgi:hypothetical protein